MFFKSLTSRSPEVVDIAKEGLKRVIQQQSLSKELLQSSLRPILVNLAHYRTSRSRCWSASSACWAPQQLVQPDARGEAPRAPPAVARARREGRAGQPARSPPKDFKIAAAMINLFHLLPQAAGKFLEPLVVLTIQLEQALPPSGVHSEVNSLYRAPLTKFLARYAPDAIDYFLARLAQPAFFFRFLDMIRSEEGEPSRGAREVVPKIIAAAFTWPRPNAGQNPASDQRAAEGLSGVAAGPTSTRTTA